MTLLAGWRGEEAIQGAGAQGRPQGRQQVQVIDAKDIAVTHVLLDTVDTLLDLPCNHSMLRFHNLADRGKRMIIARHAEHIRWYSAPLRHHLDSQPNGDRNGPAQGPDRSPVPPAHMTRGTVSPVTGARANAWCLLHKHVDKHVKAPLSHGGQAGFGSLDPSAFFSVVRINPE
jgi:hypothetical protein